jgi:hypothetical protein
VPSIDQLFGTGKPLPLPEVAHTALQIMAESVLATEGFLYIIADEARLELQASLKGEQPSVAIERFVTEFWQTDIEQDETVLQEALDERKFISDTTHDGTYHYRIVPMLAADGGEDSVAFAVLGAEHLTPRICPTQTVQRMARHLLAAAARQNPTSGSLT